jgi:hypothetical protein
MGAAGMTMAWEEITLEGAKSPSVGNLAGKLKEALEDVERVIAIHRYSAPAQMFDPASIASVSMQTASARASAFDLLWYAERRLGILRSNGKANPSPGAVRGFRRVMGQLLQDGGPTPQVAPTPSGSVEIQWVAGGYVVSALFDTSGDYNLYVVDEDHHILLDVDIEADHNPGEGDIDLLRGLLSEMGAAVKTRPASWY